MFLSENEAKEKACCKVMPQRRMNGGRFADPCLGAECMAWRWKYGIWSFRTNDWVKIGEGFLPKEAESRSTGYGYCGLIGNPNSVEG